MRRKGPSIFPGKWEYRGLEKGPCCSLRPVCYCVCVWGGGGPICGRSSGRDSPHGHSRQTAKERCAHFLREIRARVAAEDSKARTDGDAGANTHRRGRSARYHDASYVRPRGRPTRAKPPGDAVNNSGMYCTIGPFLEFRGSRTSPTLFKWAVLEFPR